MLVPFEILKVAQAASVLFRAEQTVQMTRLRLLKLLYIADRESLIERGRPITGDRPVAMDHGPVLSRTYDLIKGEDIASSVWQQFVKPDGPRGVRFAADPGIDLLSRPEIKKLEEVALRYQQWNDWKVAELTHQYPEWAKNKPPEGSSRKIPLDDLLDATGMLQNKEHLVERERIEEAAHRIFSD